MSKHETPLTEQFWQTCCPGAFIPEYRLVRRTTGQGVRLADAIILPDEPHGRATFADYPTLDGRNVVVVQTKASRLGMYLMGQGVFSAGLVKAQGAQSVRSVMIATRSDDALLPLLGRFEGIEVWISDRTLQSPPKRVFPST